MNRIIIFSLYFKAKLGFDANYNSKENKQSGLEIDIVIPVIERDLEVLYYTIKSIRENLLHKINKIYIVAPNIETINRFCEKNNCIFINEDSVLPIKKKDIKYYINGTDRSGWIFQQLLKYGMKDIVEKDFFLVTESEAVFIQPRVFEKNGKIIMPVSNALPHKPYFKTIKKLLGINFNPIYNFTSHHCLISKKTMNDLTFLIEKRSNLSRYNTILSNLDQHEMSCISDYETYGQFFYNRNKNICILEHWFNLDIKRDSLNGDFIKTLSKKMKYKVISFSRYLN